MGGESNLFIREILQIRGFFFNKQIERHALERASQKQGSAIRGAAF